MNYLELCQEALVQSDTAHGRAITDVSNPGEQSSFNSKVVRFVRDAWREIQIERAWGWMIPEFTFQTVENKETYSYDEMLDADGNRVIENFKDWFITGEEPWYVQRADSDNPGQAHGYLTHVSWATYRNTYNQIPLQASLPQIIAVSRDQKIHIAPVPDDEYTIEGQYKRSAQMFSRNEDEPLGLPEDFHMMIAFKAIMKIQSSDQQLDLKFDAQQSYNEYWYPLKDSFLPPVRVGDPLVT